MVSNSSVTPWMATHQAPWSMGFPRQEYWSWLPFPPSGDLLSPGIEPASPLAPTLADEFSIVKSPRKSLRCILMPIRILRDWFSSVPHSCLTLHDPMDCSTPGFPVHHQLWELTQTHVHPVSEAIQPSHPLSSPSPSTFNLSEHQGLFK